MTPIVSNNHTYTHIYFKNSVKEMNETLIAILWAMGLWLTFSSFFPTLMQQTCITLEIKIIVGFKD